MSDNLKFNTILGCGLAACLVVLGLHEASSILYKPAYPEKAGYAPEVQLDVGPSAGPAKVVRIDFGTDFADAAKFQELVAKGEKVHGACLSCHNFDPGGPNQTGPNLAGVLGRVAGTHPGFEYSEAMKARKEPWTYENISEFLANPQGYVKGTKMSFNGVKKPEDREALIAYLRSISPGAPALPAPLPPEPAEGAAPAAAAGGEAPAATPPAKT